MPVQKVDNNQLVKELTEKVRSIETSDIEQREKTRRHKAAVSTYMKQLYLDKRKYSGTSGEKRRVSKATARSYITKARKALEALGYRHHLFEREISRMTAKYPGYKTAIGSIDAESVKDTRLAKKSLIEQLVDARGIAAEVEAVQVQSAAGQKKLKQLAQRYPVYSAALIKLADQPDADAALALEKMIRQREDLVNDLTDLKIDHEALVNLKMPKNDQEELKQSFKTALTKKKTSTKAIDYAVYMNHVAAILSNPQAAADRFTGTKRLAPVVFALCAATGRRPIEVMITGEFEIESENKLIFSGQAKKRFEEEADAAYWIYSLVDTQLVIDAFKFLRSMDKIKELSVACSENPDDLRSLNQIVNHRTSVRLNEYAVDVFGDDTRTVKDTRGIYARIAYERFFNTDPYWANKDDDTFYFELLGHETLESQLHYKSFKVHNFSEDYEPDTTLPPSRLEKLQELDGLMPDLARADAAVKLHNDVKALIESDPGAAVNQNVLIKPPFNTFRDLAKRYLETCQEALGIVKVHNKWRNAPDEYPPVIVEADDIDDELDDPELDDVEEQDDPQPEAESDQEEETEVEAPKSKPRVKLKHKKPVKDEPAPSDKPRLTGAKSGELWIGLVTVAGQVVAQSEPMAGKMKAQAAAFAEYQKSIKPKPEPKPTTRSRRTAAGSWYVEVIDGGQVVWDLAQKGSKAQAEADAIKEYLASLS
ncbi:protelomerase family protein [Oceanospirillum sp. HFRX-1_2]